MELDLIEKEVLHFQVVDMVKIFVNGTEIHKFKAKDSKIVATPLCLGNISKDWLIDMKKKQVLMDMSITLV